MWHSHPKAHATDTDWLLLHAAERQRGQAVREETDRLCAAQGNKVGLSVAVREDCEGEKGILAANRKQIDSLIYCELQLLVTWQPWKHWHPQALS